MCVWVSAVGESLVSGSVTNVNKPQDDNMVTHLISSFFPVIQKTQELMRTQNNANQFLFDLDYLFDFLPSLESSFFLKNGIISQFMNFGHLMCFIYFLFQLRVFVTNFPNNFNTKISQS